MGHFHLIAELPCTHKASIFINAQHFAQFGRTVAEDCQILGDALTHQAQNQRLRERHGDLLSKMACSDGSFQSALGLKPVGALLHAAWNR